MRSRRNIIHRKIARVIIICAGAWDFPVVKSLQIPRGEFELTPKYNTSKYTPKYTPR